MASTTDSTIFVSAGLDKQKLDAMPPQPKSLFSRFSAMVNKLENLSCGFFLPYTESVPSDLSKEFKGSSSYDCDII